MEFKVRRCRSFSASAHFFCAVCAGKLFAFVAACVLVAARASGELELYGGVRDAFFRQRMFQRVLHAVHFRNVFDDCVYRGGIFGGAHRPNMQVVPAFDAWNAGNRFFYFAKVDGFRHCVQRKAEAFFQQVPGRD